MQDEIDFLKAELGTKQSTIEHLLQLLKSNMDVTKEISKEKRKYSDLEDSDDLTLVSESHPRPTSQIIHDWQLNALFQHDLTLCPNEDDEGNDDDDDDHNDDEDDDDDDDVSN